VIIPTSHTLPPRYFYGQLRVLFDPDSYFDLDKICVLFVVFSFFIFIPWQSAGATNRHSSCKQCTSPIAFFTRLAYLPYFGSIFVILLLNGDKNK
jgi:hypothetical protein